MFCQHCGQSLTEGAAFCKNCGRAVNTTHAAMNVNQPGDAPPYAASYAQGNYGAAQSNTQRPRRRGCLPKLITAVVILAVIAASLYFFVPGMFKPYDLGVKSSQKAYQSAVDKLGIDKDKAPEKGKPEDYTIEYGQIQQVETALSSEEITSFFSRNRPDYYALKNVQIKVHDNDTLEAAATLDTDYILKEVLNNAYSKEDAQQALPMLGLLPGQMNIRVTLSGSIEQNTLQGFGLEKASVMGIPLPESLVASEEAEDFMEKALNGYMERIAEKSGTFYDKIEIMDGELQIKARLPQSITRIPVKDEP